MTTTTPTTTQPGPDQARLRDLLRRLAEATSTDAPILSCYLDVRPEAQAERPGVRNELRPARDRLERIGETLEPHTPARESFDADRARIEELLDSDELNDADGVAVFACSAIGLWEAVRSAEPFDTEVHAGPTAELFGLARMLDDQVSAVVALVDTNTCRLFVTRRGALVERSGPDEDPAEHRRTDVGGWSQARYQRHVDMQDKRFAREAAEAIGRLVAREKPATVILAGDERIVPILEGELDEPVRALVDHVARMEMRSSPDEVAAEVAPVLSALEAAQDQELADRVVGEARARDMGVLGVNRTMEALEMGQVDELVIDETAPLDEELRAELIRQASLTDARVEVVHDHAALKRFEGVGATLRFRL